VIGEELGNYRVVAPIARGGMASVYVGEHAVLGDRVAIKVLKKRHLDNPVIERRFFNEANVIAAIRHPNIVEIVDFGRASSGAAYIVMELLEGETLRQRIRRGPIAEKPAIALIRQLAAALGEAHRMGVIHRDLKPDNILIIADEAGGGERIKLLDFGIAKRIQHAGGAREDNTATGILVGTPAYMSPEQCKGSDEIDGRSDVYSLGVVLYRMLTNKLPFEAQATGALLGKHLYVEAPAPRTINKAISVGLDRVVMRCLEKDPASRYQSMAQLSAALAALEPPSVEIVESPTLPRPQPRPPRAESPATATALFFRPAEPAAANLDVDTESGVEDTTATTVKPPTVNPRPLIQPRAPLQPRSRRRLAMAGAAAAAAALLLVAVAVGGGDSGSSAASPAAAPTSEAAEKDDAGKDSAAAVAAAAEAARAEEAERERLAAEEAERERLEAEEAERERLEAEEAERERLEAEEAERERLEAEEAERERLAAERAEAAERQRLAAAATERQRLERERAAARERQRSESTPAKAPRKKKKSRVPIYY
jgi:serine/threonine-protein kinase